MFSILICYFTFPSLGTFSARHSLDGSLLVPQLVHVCCLLHIVHNDGFRVVAAARIGRRSVMQPTVRQVTTPP